MPTTCNSPLNCYAMEPTVDISPANVAKQTDPNPLCINVTLTISWSGPGTVTGGTFNMALGWWQPGPESHLVLSAPLSSDPLPLPGPVGPGQTIHRPLHACFKNPWSRAIPGLYLVAEKVGWVNAHE